MCVWGGGGEEIETVEDGPSLDFVRVGRGRGRLHIIRTATHAPFTLRVTFHVTCIYACARLALRALVHVHAHAYLRVLMHVRDLRYVYLCMCMPCLRVLVHVRALLTCTCACACLAYVRAHGALQVNPVKGKKLTNMRSTGADEKVFLAPPRRMTLEDYITYMGPDEVLEVTPNAIRLRKKLLDSGERERAQRTKKQQQQNLKK